ncbi:MAG: chromosome segregation protein SMC, partial [Caulobacteraceae bacterium]
RDVQLLFADASTGANSPALVRQGQISELIAAKPSNRRRILEEAAGVSGLHTRRHEADLRLRAAEANLVRLDDVIRELESTLARLRREARQAETYKTVAAELRALQSAAVYGRWLEAKTALDAASVELAMTEAAVQDGARDAAAASAVALAAGEGLKPLREEEMVAAAVLQRLTHERDRLEREEAEARAEAARLEADLARIDADFAREGQALDDAAGVLRRLERDLAEVEAAIAAAPERGPELAAALAEAEAARALADGEVERLAGEAASQAARVRAATERLEQAEALVRAAQGRAADADARVARTRRALETARADRAALPAGGGPEAEAAKADFDAALTTLAAVRAHLENAEAARTEAARAEATARDKARAAEDALRTLRSEAQGLLQLANSGVKSKFAPALNSVSPQRGYEAALAAALGDDLDAALDAQAPAFWGGADATAPAWPEGATPLAPLVDAPPELAARLAFTALVDRAAGPKLQKRLPAGARLVSREGDLWRWDGFTSKAEAPRPAAKRLAQKARLTEVEAEIAAKAPATEAAAKAHREAAAALQAAEETLRTARRAPDPAERVVAKTREAVESHAREQVRRDARVQSLDETVARFEAELAEVEAVAVSMRAQVDEAEAALEAVRYVAPVESGDDIGAALAKARDGAGEARQAEANARAAMELERRERETRLRRRDGIQRDQGDWSRRAKTAEARQTELTRERARVETALAAARTTPTALAERRERLLTDLGAAEQRRGAAADKLATAETLHTEAERAQRLAESRAGEAREARAAASARTEGASERFEIAADQLRQTTRMEPDEVAATLDDRTLATLSDPAGLDARLAKLERDREAIGLVNLRAAEEAEEHGLRLDAMRAERADLSGAVSRLRMAIEELNAEGRERVLAAFEVINEGFKVLFATLFEGGEAELRLVESDDPLEAGLEIYACPPGKRLAAMSLMSGGEQALTATALIFGVFLANPAPICVLDEVDAPLDDANVDRFCKMLDEMRRRTGTRFIAITHNPVTMSRMDRLFGVTMSERGVSQLVSVDLRQAETLAAQ